MTADVRTEGGECKARKRKSHDLWYKRYPARFRRDTTHEHPMSFELRGAWGLLVDLFYEHGRPLPNDDKWIANQLGCDVRKWKHIRTQLTAYGKLFVGADGLLHNKTADEVIEERATKLVKTRVAAATRRRVVGARIPRTPASTPASTTPSTWVDLSGMSNDFNDLGVAKGAVRAILLSSLPRKEEDSSCGRVDPDLADAPPWHPVGIADDGSCVVPFTDERRAAA